MQYKQTFILLYRELKRLKKFSASPMKTLAPYGS